MSLRHLEGGRIVRREVFPTVPVSVEYSLTDKGLDFLDSLKEMEKWAENGEWNNPHDSLQQL